METIQLTGRCRIDKGVILKDPLVTLLNANYDYSNMNVVLIVEYSNTQYKHVRELEPATITSTNGLTKEEVITIVNNNLVQKKQ